MRLVSGFHVNMNGEELVHLRVVLVPSRASARVLFGESITFMHTNAETCAWLLLLLLLRELPPFRVEPKLWTLLLLVH